MKKTNDRCPLQAECERKCQYVGHELDCVYYHTNGVGEDRTIPDQEEIRRERERKVDDAWMAERMAEIADDEEEQETQGENNKMVYIPIEKLSPHPDNPRKDLGDLTELVDSIRENGIFQNLTVVKLYGEISKQWFGRYRIIIGHRRHAAAKIAGLKELPCVVVEMTPKEQMSTMLLENMQRSDLTVYEQAQGFQMMLDMGDTVADVAKSTGLSATTVRRRVKLTELDQKVLKEVASRQVSISDFDKLAQIDDVDARNEVLQTIGTDNFNMRLQQKVKAQRIQKNLPLFKETLKKSKAKKIQLSDTWNGKYDEIRGTSVDIDKFEGTEIMLPTTDEDLFYCLQEDIGRVRYFTKRKSAPPVKRSQAEIDKEKAIKAAHERCEELDDLCRSLRADFVKGLVLTSKNRDAMLSGVAGAIISMGFKYASVSSTTFCNLAGIERKYENGEQKRVADTLLADEANTIPAIIYAAFDDNKNEVYHTTYKSDWPHWNDSLRLNMLYRWLTSVGYVMSDDEKTMQDGTHEVLNRDKVKKEDCEEEVSNG